MSKNSKQLLRSWHRFLQENFNVFKQSAPEMFKQRKYEHVEIQQQFEQIDAERRKERLALIEYRKKLKKRLLEQQLEFMKKNHNVRVLGDDAGAQLRQELENAKKTHEVQQFSSYDQFVKNVIKLQTQNSEKPAIEHVVKPEEQQQEIEKLEAQLSKLNQELSDINTTKQDIQALEQKIEQLEPGYTLITGMKKKIVQAHLSYLEFQSRHLQGLIIHPETKKAIETVHYHVEHNLPIRTELLLEVMPEHFTTELEQLDKIEQEKILEKRLQFKVKEGSLIKVFGEQKFEKNNEPGYIEEMLANEEKMRDMIYMQAVRFAEKWGGHFEMKQKQGFYSDEVIIENILNKAPELRTEEEQLIYNDYMDLQKAQDDFTEFIEVNRARTEKKINSLKMPKFVEQNEKLKQAWIKKWEEVVVPSFDIKDSVLTPCVDNVESKLDKVLSEQRQTDIKSIIEQSQKEYEQKIGGNEPVRGRDRFNKDQDLVKRLNVLANAMDEVTKDTETKKIPVYHQGLISGQEQPEEQRITLSEFPKILFLNSKDPKKYNLQFWAQHFNIEPQKLRNIFNYVSYAVPDVTNEKETGRVFRFIYD